MSKSSNILLMQPQLSCCDTYEMVTRSDHPVQIHMMDVITYPCLGDSKPMLVKGCVVA